MKNTTTTTKRDDAKRVEAMLEKLVPATSDLDRDIYALIGRVATGDFSPTMTSRKVSR